MNNYFEEIKEKLSRQIKIEQIEVIDNTKKHQNHKFFVKDKYHLHLKIKSQYLQSITRLNAQKIIMKVLKQDLRSKIHALEISIE
tara:strand:+ start:2976 stop:3230 length:255 start_codon:yes stop_codon:yes gene_type:complete